MIRINLLPHREEKRKERRKQFYTLAGAIFAVGILIVLLVHIVNESALSSQEARNTIFNDAITQLDTEISEIKDLKLKINRLLARKQVIESLQSNRAETVHLFNELAARIPTGVYLTKILQDGDVITLIGSAQSNARVSQLMTNLNESPFLQDSEVKQSQANTSGSRRVYDFEISVHIERSAEPTEQTVADAEPAQRSN